ncbi:uncharacterized protein METZ01_LOCUS147847, partial [marine metagenome]
ASSYWLPRKPPLVEIKLNEYK